MSNKLVSKSSSKSDKKATFKIEKDLSLNNIEQAKNELEEIISKNPNFHLELKNIDSFDLSSIQLLYAIKSKLKDNFSYSIEMKDELKTIFQHAGFDYILNK
jgi:DNA-binding transcriptional regulator GbsR (MarR family)